MRAVGARTRRWTRLEYERESAPDPTATYGWRFATVTRLGRGCRVAPRAVPDVLVSVGDLLP